MLNLENNITTQSKNNFIKRRRDSMQRNNFYWRKAKNLGETLSIIPSQEEEQSRKKG